LTGQGSWDIVSMIVFHIPRTRDFWTVFKNHPAASLGKKLSALLQFGHALLGSRLWAKAPGLIAGDQERAELLVPQCQFQEVQ
jgi:hypothetical protein